MTGNEIRRVFLEFFAERGHRIVRSSSLVPAADPTLLFTNAGMNQFKDVFLALDQRDYRRAASAQKCLRVSGKHNDLENVGRTRRHHTFFEMLGNFSFGEYFKREAIQFAWELFTQVYKLPPEKLIATVFREDDEAYTVWEKEIGIAADRLYRLDEKDNFWAMGDTGPCGPCSEIQYDLGPAGSELGHKDCRFPCECGRYVELWNLVFMQFNRDADGKTTPLPKPSVDTGAGLERLATVLQGKISNYDTDLFRPLIDHAADLASKNYGEEPPTDMALRVIADHSRAAAFVVADGVLPANEGRGYVLRKVIRRAIDHGRQLDLEKPFLFEMAGRVAELMREPYPELLDSLQRVATVIKGEEEKYARLIIPAVKALEVYRADEMHQQDSVDVRMFPVTGAQLFYAYDTHGLRPDFVLDLAKQRGWPVERDAEIKFQKELGKQRERAKASWKAVEKAFAEEVYRKWSEKYRTTFLGHTHTKVDECRILAMVEKQRPKLVKDEKMSAEVSKKVYPEFEILLDQTPFYAEAGGQVGDTGWMLLEGEVVARVVDTYSPIVGLVAHRVELLGNASPETLVDRRVTAQVDASRRSATMRNHTGTHLLHAALRNVLGPHVKQSGSLVAPDRLRFDFTHYAALDPEELSEIERLANEQILRDVPVQEERLDLDAALKSGALAFFGDKYPEKNVRVITVPDPGEEAGFYSKELCGGTHVRQTGQIGVLKVVSEASVAAGVRRVEAVTGTGALREYQQAQETLQQLAAALHVSEAETLEAVTRLAQQVKQLEKQLGKAKHRSAHRQADELVGRVRQVRDVGVLAAVVQDVDRNTMRSLVDSLRQKLGSGVIVLGTSADGKVALIAAVTKDLTKRVHAGKLVKEVAGRVRGSGGGRADLAEAGGKDPGQLRQALEDVYAIVEKML